MCVMSMLEVFAAEIKKFCSVDARRKKIVISAIHEHGTNCLNRFDRVFYVNHNFVL